MNEHGSAARTRGMATKMNSSNRSNQKAILLNDHSEGSNASCDSFDWIGEDYSRKDSQVIETDDTDFTEIPTREDSSPGLLYLLTIGLLAIVLFSAYTALIGLFCALLLGLYVIEFWREMAFMTVFSPFLIHFVIGQLIQSRNRPTMSLLQSESSGHLMAIQKYLTMLLTTLLISYVWLSKVSLTCPSSLPLEQGIMATAPPVGQSLLEGAPPCLQAYVPRLFLFLVVYAMSLMLTTWLVRELRSSFQGRTLKNHLLENRFRLFVVDQLVLAALTKSQNINGHILSPFLLLLKHSMWLLRVLTDSRDPTCLLKERRNMRQSQGKTKSTKSTKSASFLSSLYQNLLQSIEYKSLMNATPRTDLQAKQMARMIFTFLCPGQRNHLLLTDFDGIFPSPTIYHKAYSIFEHDGIITRSDFRTAMMQIFLQQRNLAQEVANTKSIFESLDGMIMWLVKVGLLLFLFSLVGIRITSILALSGSLLLGLSFMIVEGARRTFNSLLFLLLSHPYDIGDRIVVGDGVAHGEEEILTVVRISIQNTIFRRWNGAQLCMPNHLLAADTITNLTRTSELWERIDFELALPEQRYIGGEEGPGRIDNLRHRINSFVHTYPNDYYQNFDLRAVIAADNAKGDRCLEKGKFTLKIRCRETEDNQQRWIRHARILAFLRQAISSR